MSPHQNHPSASSSDWDLSPPNPALAGHLAVVANQCYDCEGPLRDAHGTFSERMEDNGRVAFAACICNGCKAKHQAEARCDAAHPEDDEVRCYLLAQHKGKHRYN